MSWQDRLRQNITLTSPLGTIFEPKWIGNERSKEKKLGLFTYPNVAGTVVQDLNISSTRWPLTVYFSNSDHDLDSEDFWNALDETGLWRVIHPTKGLVDLQLVSASENVQPVTDGNYTVFNLEFIQPAGVDVLQSGEAQKSLLDRLLDALNDNALTQFADQVEAVSDAARTAVNNAVKSVNGAIDSVLGPIAQIDDAIDSAYTGIGRSIDNAIDAVTLAPEQLAGSLQNLVQLPARATLSSSQKLAVFSNLISEVSKLEGTTKETFAVKDLVLSAANGAISIIAANTDAQTRTDIVNQVENISSSFDNIVNTLSNDQDNVETDKLEDQYISQETSYPQNLILASAAIRFLLQASADLSIEKRFILKEYRLPIFITIKEYGTDELLDYFYETNKIEKEDFLLLPPGREVVVYPGVIV